MRRANHVAASGHGTHVAMSPPEEAAPEELPQSPRFTLLQHRIPEASPVTIVAAASVPIAVCLAVAVLMGCILNDKYFGSAGSGGTTALEFNVNVLWTTICTATTAAAMSLVRFCSKYFLKPRLYGTLGFLTFIALVACLLTETYTDGAVTTRAAVELSSQVISVLGGNFNYQDAKFPTTFSGTKLGPEFNPNTDPT